MNTSVTDQLPDTVTSAIDGTLDAVRTTAQVIDLGDVTDTLGDAATVVIDTAGDLVGSAGEVTVHGGRLVIRGLRAGGRSVRAHPKVSVGIVALILAAVAALAWKSRRTDTADTTHLKAAA